MLYINYLLFKNNIFILFTYFTVFCKINLNNIFYFFSYNKNIIEDVDYLDNYIDNNLDDNLDDNLYFNNKIIYKSISTERIKDAKFIIDDGPIYI
jgi:hypothetical protein